MFAEYRERIAADRAYRRQSLAFERALGAEISPAARHEIMAIRARNDA
jgi:hypothetical protein